MAKRVCSRSFYKLAAALCLVVQVGCGGGGGATSIVSGTVTKGGQPVPNVNIAFLGAQGAASAITDASGQFRIAEPIPVGDYRASVTKPAAAPIDPDSAEYEAIMAGRAEAPAAVEDDLVPVKYRSTATSGLEYQFSSGANDINVTLD